MEEKKLTELNNLELLKEVKKIKTDILTHATLIGLFLGVFIYSAVKNVFTFFTFFPLFFVYLLVNNAKKKKELEKELKNELNSRNMK